MYLCVPVATMVARTHDNVPLYVYIVHLVAIPDARTVAQAVSRRPGTADTLVRSQATLCGGFMLDKVVQEQVSVRTPRFSLVSIILLLPHTLPLLCYQRYVILAIKSVVK